MVRVTVGALVALLASPLAHAQSYLPLQEGHAWTYQRTESVNAGSVKTQTSGNAELRCLEATQINGQAAYVLGWKGESRRLVVSSTADSITVHRAGDDLFLLPVNFADPAAEAKRVKVATVAVEQYTVGAAAKVKTPAGTFEAVPVSTLVRTPATTVRVTVHYARGVGPVKLVEEVKAPATTITRTHLLSSSGVSVPGRADPPPEVEVEREAEPEVEVEVEAPDPVKAPADALSIAELVKAGAQANLGEAVKRIANVQAAISAITGEEAAGDISEGKAVAKGENVLVNDSLHHKRFVCQGMTVNDSVHHALVISDGDVVINGEVHHAVVITNGNVAVNGELHHSLVISRGDISVQGEVHHGTLLAHGLLSVHGEAKYMTLQSTNTSALGEVTRSVFVNGKALEGRKNRAHMASPGPRELFPLK